MIEQLEHRKTELKRLREERGATDPILIIAGIAITLILLVGGSFAISGFIANANNLNAKGDLDRIATAQAAYMAQKDSYGAFAYGPNVSSPNAQLQDSALGFAPSAGTNTIVRTSTSGWVASTKSASGAVYIRSSESAETFELNGSMAPGAPTYGAWTESRRNLSVSPYGGTGMSGWTVSERWAGAGGTASHALVTATDGPLPEIGQYLRKTWTTVGSAALDVGYAFNRGGRIPVTAGDTYTFSYYWRPSWNTGTNLNRITVQFHNVASGGTPVSSYNTPDSPKPAANEWQRLSATVTIPAGVTYVDVWHNMYASLPSVGSTIDGTGLLVEKTSTLLPYFDGRTVSSDPTIQNVWTGATDRSVSVQNSRSSTPGASVWSPTAQPSNFALPQGISWANIVSDVQDIYS